ncbi:MAG: cation-transporting P-type ATPase [Candidatus Micrarchaeota archaeon]
MLKPGDPSINGLSGNEAASRLKEYGFNQLEEGKKVTPLDIFLRQFKSFVTYILIAAALISLLISEILNFLVISAIIMFVVVLGFIQEYRSEKALAELKKIVEPMSRVYRNGRLTEVPTRELVPGDVVVVESGDKVPADCRMAEKTYVRVDESALTGESVPVEKKSGDMLFSGTQVTEGRCKAKVESTGMRTKLGAIASLIQAEVEETPLQRKITQLSRTLAGIAIGACALTFVVGLYKGAPIAEILIISLALAVAAVPEGLPLTLTLTLAFGMKRMAEKKAIVRKMLAVETLGSVTVIATDKTGTLTKNEMTVEKIYFGGRIADVSGSGFLPAGEISVQGKKLSGRDKEAVELTLRAGALCNNSVLEQAGGAWKVIGDPTEGALVVAAAKMGLEKSALDSEYERSKELPFASERKLMTTFHETESGMFAYMKGAPENVLGKCTRILWDGEIRKLSSGDRKAVDGAASGFSEAAYRCLGIAFKEYKAGGDDESGMVFLGLVALRDPPREEVSSAIATCRSAGIKVVMITGDSRETALAIAKDIRIIDGSEKSAFEGMRDPKLRRMVEDHTITGDELDEISERELAEIVDGIKVYSRILPEQKLRIVKALKANGHIVAMTGDGVNDAPALKTADIGVSMGLKGTDVARESSSLVLQDDNFSTIVEAVKQGRAIFSNIEKFTTYLISRNFTEIVLILLGMLFLDFEFIPLLALQILFINTFDEIMPAISLGLDPARESLMNRKPRDPGEQILKRRNLAIIFSVALFMGVSSFMVYLSSNPWDSLEKARTMTFATIISSILFVPFAFRSLDESVLKTGFSSNRLMVIGSSITFLLTLIAMYTPQFHEIFSLTYLTPVDWALPLGVGLATMAFIELVKLAIRRMPGAFAYPTQK